MTNPEGFPPLSLWTSLLAPRMLPWTGVTRYPAPKLPLGVSGRSSPQSEAIIVLRYYTTI